MSCLILLTLSSFSQKQQSEIDHAYELYDSGMRFKEQGDLYSSLSAFEKSFDLFYDNERISSAAAVINECGETLKYYGYPDEAYDIYRVALKEFCDLKEYKKAAIVLENILSLRNYSMEQRYIDFVKNFTINNQELKEYFANPVLFEGIGKKRESLRNFLKEGAFDSLAYYDYLADLEYYETGDLKKAAFAFHKVNDLSTRYNDEYKYYYSLIYLFDIFKKTKQQKELDSISHILSKDISLRQYNGLYLDYIFLKDTMSQSEYYQVFNLLKRYPGLNYYDSLLNKVSSLKIQNLSDSDIAHYKLKIYELHRLNKNSSAISKAVFKFNNLKHKIQIAQNNKKEEKYKSLISIIILVSFVLVFAIIGFGFFKIKKQQKGIESLSVRMQNEFEGFRSDFTKYLKGCIWLLRRNRINSSRQKQQILLLEEYVEKSAKKINTIQEYNEMLQVIGSISAPGMDEEVKKKAGICLNEIHLGIENLSNLNENLNRLNKN